MKKLIFTIWVLVLAVVINIERAEGQWVQIGPYGGEMQVADSFESTLLVGGNPSLGLFRSLDNGNNWHRLLVYDDSMKYINSIEITATSLFVGTPRDLFDSIKILIQRSSDNGETWIVSDSGINKDNPYSSTRTIKSINGMLFAGISSSGMYRSTSNGSYWTSINNGITDFFGFADIITHGSNIFVLGSSGFIYRSSDNGENWTNVFNLSPVNFRVIESLGSDLFVGTYENGILRSSDNGNSWNYVNNGLTNFYIHSLKYFGTDLFAGTNKGVFVSHDNGNNWSPVNEFLGKWIPLIFSGNSRLFVSTSNGIFQTSDNGVNWSDANQGISMKYITSFASNDEYLFTGTYWGELFRTSNQGINWTLVGDGSITGSLIESMIAKDNYLLCGAEKLLLSSNNGDTWNILHSGSIGRFFCFTKTSEYIFAGGFDGVFRTSNYGANWIAMNNGLTNLFIRNIVSTDAYIFASTETEIYRSSDFGGHWIRSNSGISGKIKSLNYNGTFIFAAGENGIFRSSDNGNNWVIVNNGYTGLNATSIESSGNKIFVGNNLGLFFSNNNGLNWGPMNEGFNSHKNVNRLRIYDDKIYAGMSRGSVLKRPISEFTHEITSNDLGVSNFPDPAMNIITYLNCDSDLVINPKVEVVNFGSNNQDNLFDIKIEIRENGALFYSDTKQDTLSAGLSRIINFNPIVLPRSTTEKKFIAKSWTVLDTDTNHSNDTATSAFTFTNINFGGGKPSNFGYFFANSTPSASCAPDQPIFYWEDTTGSISLISNGVARIPLSGGNLNDGYFLLSNILPPGDKFQFNGICYDTFGISTNGIIGLGSSTEGLSYQPPPMDFGSSDVPGAAIFAFWYNFDFSASMITGRNLKYKVADNKIIITYDRVPKWYPTDANDYATFQVILETSPFCGLNNGIVTVQYDNTKCGSTFINQYSNNTLGSHKVGIQNISGDKFINYRFKTNQGLITSGPLFSSQIALSFNSDNALLPVELTSFTSSVIEKNITLYWHTNRETNNSGFDIERSILKDQWTKAGFVPANGNSNEPKDYSFTDKNLAVGKYKYRLKQIDFNGSFEYFNLAGEVTIGIPDKYELSQNYPNPFNPSTVIRYSLIENSFTSLKIYDVIGREITKLVNEKQEAGRYEVIFNGSNFASGVYFYELRSGNFVSQKRMLLLK